MGYRWGWTQPAKVREIQALTLGIDLQNGRLGVFSPNEREAFNAEEAYFRNVAAPGIMMRRAEGLPNPVEPIEWIEYLQRKRDELL